MAENKKPLLWKENKLNGEYNDEKCPGCMVDRRKAENPNLPVVHFFYIWIITLSASLPISSIFPFLYYMVRDFHIAKREEDISFYAGFEGSAFMLGRFATAIIWGMVADRYGRKPVMILSTLAVVVFNTLFGLSTSYWMAIATRFLLGALCGTLGPMRAYATEVSRREHQSLGVAMISSAWGIGLVIGPALGGYLALPAEKFPHLFSPDSIFGRFPYFLVSLVISFFALVVFVICFWLPETLHSHKFCSKIQDETHDVEDATKFPSEDLKVLKNTKGETKSSWLSLLKNWPLMSVTVLYCIFQMHDMAYVEISKGWRTSIGFVVRLLVLRHLRLAVQIFSLWANSPRSYGGLSFSTEDVGQALAVAGIALLFCQVLLYPIVERIFGPITVSRVCAVLSIALLSSYPFIAKLSGRSLSLVVDLASALKNVFAVTITTGLYLLQNRAVSQQQRGAANGLSLCIMSFCKAFGPAAAGSLLSWGQSRLHASFLPGTHLVFFVLNLVEFIGLLMTFKPFLVEPAQEYS